MARLRGRAPKGQRCVASVPHGHWMTTTFVAGLRIGGMSAPMLLEGPMDGDAFLAYIEQVLAPTLMSGEIVIMDNLPAHKVHGVQEAIEARGAELRYLPAYSPDFNPIEMAFSKLKAILRAAAKRTLHGLWAAVAAALDRFKPNEAKTTSRQPDMTQYDRKMLSATAPAAAAPLPRLDCAPGGKRPARWRAPQPG